MCSLGRLELLILVVLEAASVFTHLQPEPCLAWLHVHHVWRVTPASPAHKARIFTVSSNGEGIMNCMTPEYIGAKVARPPRQECFVE